ncbi:Glu/Leu/Phe/Val dehydrogenase family protein [Methylobacterium frigidaeris]|uniref:Leucine dehydrogenase n=1 Tax=Methylobacterium frigidaeris TaxID=2038277 RepID=A0AA37HJG1_9HYPH|nr:Glu/Leu/Phe/Val dehydrogenase dimerization domain-containing protein [Methylobacterium frigidaeris]GJD66636.1 Leucine dehydrogenase [Methylobacterium frigidaeris]
MNADPLDLDGHEMVIQCRDAGSGLRAIIAIHDSSAGPAMGGCRIAAYPSTAAALTDALRLSRGMTFKNIMAGLPHGGGKSVILLERPEDKTPALLLAFAERVNGLGGRYITGEDVGSTVADIQLMRKVTPHVRGIPENGPGDPSPMTALGVFVGIRKAVLHRLGAETLTGLTVAVQGLGAVGSRLCGLLHDVGARLVVADVDPARAREAADRFGAAIARPEEVHGARADVFAPCALGAVLDAGTIRALGAAVVAGGANNQLATAQDGARLAERGILYAPDYVINAGGVISTALEGPGYERGELLRRVHGIADTLGEIFEHAIADGVATSAVADRLALGRLEAARHARRSAVAALPAAA